MSLLATDYIVCNADPTSANKWLGQSGGHWVYGNSASATVFTNKHMAEQVAAVKNGVAVPANALNTWTPR